MLETEIWIGDSFQSFNTAFKDKHNLDNIVQKELLDPFAEKVSSIKPSRTFDLKPTTPQTSAPSYPSTRQVLIFRRIQVLHFICVFFFYFNIVIYVNGFFLVHFLIRLRLEEVI